MNGSRAPLQQTTRRAMSSDSCGCAMSARFMAVALVGAGAYYGWQWHLGERSLLHTGLAVIAWAFGAALAGKLTGITAHRMQLRQRGMPKPSM